jgi:hypothetical protein
MTEVPRIWQGQKAAAVGVDSSPLGDDRSLILVVKRRLYTAAPTTA